MLLAAVAVVVTLAVLNTVAEEMAKLAAVAEAEVALPVVESMARA